MRRPLKFTPCPWTNWLAGWRGTGRLACLMLPRGKSVTEAAEESKADSLRTSTDIKIKEVEERLNKKLQRALDNPLANN